MNISYDYYRTFYFVAKCGNITQAASLLLNNQPNVTRIIKNLETELGCILFIRSHHGVHLTPEGKQLFEHIRIAFEHIEAGEKELALNKNLQQGTITIGASEIALHCLLLPILKEFRQLYPDIHIRLSNHTTLQAIESLKHGFVDIAVVSTPLDIDHSLECRTIKDVQEIAVCSSAFAELADQPLALSELAQYPLISLNENTKTFAFYSDFFRSNNVPFTPSVEAATTDQILPLVKHDLGIGFIPKAFLEAFNQSSSIHFLDLVPPIPKRAICLVKRKDASLSLAAKKLEEMVLMKAEKNSE